MTDKEKNLPDENEATVTAEAEITQPELIEEPVETTEPDNADGEPEDQETDGGFEGEMIEEEDADALPTGKGEKKRIILTVAVIAAAVLLFVGAYLIYNAFFSPKSRFFGDAERVAEHYGELFEESEYSEAIGELLSAANEIENYRHGSVDATVTVDNGEESRGFELGAAAAKNGKSLTVTTSEGELLSVYLTADGVTVRTEDGGLYTADTKGFEGELPELKGGIGYLADVTPADLVAYEELLEIVADSLHNGYFGTGEHKFDGRQCRYSALKLDGDQLFSLVSTVSARVRNNGDQALKSLTADLLVKVLGVAEGKTTEETLKNAAADFKEASYSLTVAFYFDGDSFAGFEAVFEKGDYTFSARLSRSEKGEAVLTKLDLTFPTEEVEARLVLSLESQKKGDALVTEGTLRTGAGGELSEEMPISFTVSDGLLTDLSLSYKNTSDDTGRITLTFDGKKLKGEYQYFNYYYQRTTTLSVSADVSAKGDTLSFEGGYTYSSEYSDEVLEYMGVTAEEYNTSTTAAIKAILTLKDDETGVYFSYYDGNGAGGFISLRLEDEFGAKRADFSSDAEYTDGKTKYTFTATGSVDFKKTPDKVVLPEGGVSVIDPAEDKTFSAVMDNMLDSLSDAGRKNLLVGLIYREVSDYLYEKTDYYSDGGEADYVTVNGLDFESYEEVKLGADMLTLNQLAGKELTPYHDKYYDLYYYYFSNESFFGDTTAGTVLTVVADADGRIVNKAFADYTLFTEAKPLPASASKIKEGSTRDEVLGYFGTTPYYAISEMDGEVLYEQFYSGSDKNRTVLLDVLLTDGAVTLINLEK